jgi:hypothetical protein
VSHWLDRDIFSVFQGGEPVYRAIPTDEYRELAMLAHAWELRALGPGVAAEPLREVDEGKGK